MHKDDCIWTEPNRCNCGWLQDIAKNPRKAGLEIERLRAELLCVCKLLIDRGRHAEDGKYCEICEVVARARKIAAARKGEEEGDGHAAR